MSMNTHKNVYHCHRCKERGNSIALYMKLVGVSDARTAYREIMEEIAA
jgi:DNA primase